MIKQFLNYLSTLSLPLFLLVLLGVMFFCSLFGWFSCTVLFHARRGKGKNRWRKLQFSVYPPLLRGLVGWVGNRLIVPLTPNRLTAWSFSIVQRIIRWVGNWKRRRSFWSMPHLHYILFLLGSTYVLLFLPLLVLSYNDVYHHVDMIFKYSGLHRLLELNMITKVVYYRTPGNPAFLAESSQYIKQGLCYRGGTGHIKFTSFWNYNFPYRVKFHHFLFTFYVAILPYQIYTLYHGARFFLSSSRTFKWRPGLGPERVRLWKYGEWVYIQSKKMNYAMGLFLLLHVPLLIDFLFYPLNRFVGFYN